MMNMFDELNRAYRREVDALTFIRTFGMAPGTRLAERLDQLESGQWIVVRDMTTDDDAAMLLPFRTQIVSLDEYELRCTNYLVPRHGLAVPPHIFNSGGVHSQGKAIELVDPPVVEQPTLKPRFSDRWRAALQAFRT